jgi:hypothetical protein
VTSWVETMAPVPAFRISGLVSCRLRISREKVSLLYREGAEVSDQPGRLDTAAELLLLRLDRLRGTKQNAGLLEIGDALARACRGISVTMPTEFASRARAGATGSRSCRPRNARFRRSAKGRSGRAWLTTRMGPARLSEFAPGLSG